MKFRFSLIFSLLVAFALTFGACAPDVPETGLPEAEVHAIQTPANSNLILATTTSTQDSGLLDELIPLFETETGYTVQTVAVGSGQALKMGQEGNADVLLVHAPAAEVRFMENGSGKDRALVMHNDFVIVGPVEDPAGVRGKSALEALTVIHARAARFVSRGDESGTHQAELNLWKEAGLDPRGQAWYLESGQGMGATLMIASEKMAYTLADRGTYLASQNNLQLEVLVEGDRALLNVYHVITVNPAKWPDVNYGGAVAFLDFITGPSAQQVIAEFGVERFGQPLFFPDATKTDADLGL